MLDEKRWNKLIERLTGIAPQDGPFRQIVASYSEPHRHYHDFRHIEQCLAEFDEVKSLCGSPDEVEFAIWLHDVVYDPHASDNEEMSAIVATKILSGLGCPENKTDIIRKLILITKHVQIPKTADAQVIVDIDLSILGQSPDIFDTYENNIRAEFSWVPDEKYLIRRSSFLQGFLDRASIYHTARFEKLYGDQARKNLSRVLFALRHSALETGS